MYSSGYRIRSFIQFNHSLKDAWKRYFGMEIDGMKYILLKIYLHFFGVHSYGENSQNMPARLPIDQVDFYWELRINI